MEPATVQPETPSPRQVLIIRARSQWSLAEWVELWQFRDLLATLAARDVKLRYRQTALGVVWVILQPVMAAGIFTFVFGRIAKLTSEGIPYFLFSYAGLLGWNAFSSTLTKSGASLVGNAALISKVYFPRLILPLSGVLSTLLDFSIGLAFMVPLYWYYHVAPGWGVLLLPLWFLLTVTLASGLGILMSALTVTYRDVQYILPVFIQFLVYATAVGYSVAAAPAGYRAAIMANPLSTLMEGVRCSLLGTTAPPWPWIGYTVGCTLVLSLVAVLVFRQMEARFADVI
jgi:lipopolysaccharide transport system permease protein